MDGVGNGWRESSRLLLRSSLSLSRPCVFAKEGELMCVYQSSPRRPRARREERGQGWDGMGWRGTGLAHLLLLHLSLSFSRHCCVPERDERPPCAGARGREEKKRDGWMDGWRRGSGLARSLLPLSLFSCHGLVLRAQREQAPSWVSSNPSPGARRERREGAGEGAGSSHSRFVLPRDPVLHAPRSAPRRPLPRRFHHHDCLHLCHAPEGELGA